MEKRIDRSILNADNIIWLDRKIDVFERQIEHLESKTKCSLQQVVETLIIYTIIDVLKDCKRKVLNSTVELDKEGFKRQVISCVKERFDDFEFISAKDNSK